MDEMLIAIPKTFENGMIIGYFMGAVINALLFTYLLVKTEYFR